MPVKVPYQFVEGLDGRAREQLWRNFEEIQRSLSNVSSTGDFEGTIPAAQVTAGTFGAGSYTFTGGKLTVDSTTATNVKAIGSGAGYSFAERDTGTEWVWYANAAVARLWRGGDLVTVDSAGNLTANNAQIYKYAPDGTYAGFRNKNNTNAYQILARDSGLILIRSGPTDRRVLIGSDAGWHFAVESTKIDHNVETNQYGSLHMRDGWVRSYGAVGWYSQTYGGGIFMQDTTWVRTYGGKSFYTAGGEIRSDNRIVASAAGGSTGFYVYSSTDTNHRIFYDSAANGPRMTGWGAPAIGGIQHDTMIEAGRFSAVNRHVNLGSSVWRPSDALTHTNMSDPRFKRGMHRVARQAEKVRAIHPIDFQWDEKHDVREPGRRNFGFSADDLPEEVTHTSFLINEETGEPEPVKMMDPVGVLAMLWEAFLEEADRADQFEQRIAAVERRGAP